LPLSQPLFVCTNTSKTLTSKQALIENLPSLHAEAVGIAAELKT